MELPNTLLFVSLYCVSLLQSSVLAKCGGRPKPTCKTHEDCLPDEACLGPVGNKHCYYCLCTRKEQCTLGKALPKRVLCHCTEPGFTGKVCDCPKTGWKGSKIKAIHIVFEARKNIGSTKWSTASCTGTGSGTDKCNQFVFDVLKTVGTNPPSRHWWKYSPIGAGEWGNPQSTYLTNANCWNICTGFWQMGDVISDGGHVGIITGNQLTTSATSTAVVENDWGFRLNGIGSTQSITACWRSNDMAPYDVAASASPNFKITGNQIPAIWAAS